MAGGIRPDLAIGFLGEQWRHREELEIVERREALALDHRSTLALNANPYTRPSQPGRR